MYITSPDQLANVIRNARKEKSITQAEAASLVGIKQATVSAFENHPEGTQLETLFKILSALELQLTVLPRGLPPEHSDWTEEW